MPAITPPTQEIIPGVPFGRIEDVFSPAFWREMASAAQRGEFGSIQLGDNLGEEVAACLLGGYGMPAEIGLAAFYRLKERNLLYPGVTSSKLEAALKEEFNGRKYRFPRQKARFLAESLERLSQIEERVCDIAFRDELATLPGVGLKTASWIVRNRRNSDNVAVLDVHIVRAGRYIGFFSRSTEPSRHYRTMENRFISFARGLEVRAVDLDSAMWQVMRSIGYLLPQPPYQLHLNVG